MSNTFLIVFYSWLIIANIWFSQGKWIIGSVWLMMALILLVFKVKTDMDVKRIINEIN